MKIKEGASIQGIQFVMREVLINADRIWRENGQELVITAGTDGMHSAASLHYYGLALDFRTKYFDDIARKRVYKLLLEELGDRFTVILEDTHIHVQLNLKANQPQQ